MAFFLNQDCEISYPNGLFKTILQCILTLGVKKESNEIIHEMSNLLSTWIYRKRRNIGTCFPSSLQMISNITSKKRIERDLSSQKDTSNSRKNTSNRKKMVGYIFFYHEQFPFHIKKLDQLYCWKHSEKYWNMLQLPHQYITHAVFWYFGWNVFIFCYLNYKKILSFREN